MSVNPSPEQIGPGSTNAAPQGIPAAPLAAPAVPPQPAAAAPNYTPIALGAVGSVIALAGALLGWVLVQSCASVAGFFSACVTVPAPAGYGGVDSMVAMAPTVAMLGALLGLVMLLLQKPVTGLVAGLMGIVTLLFAVVFLTSFGGVESAISAQVGGVASASVNVTIGIGVYITIVGGALLAGAGFMQFAKLKATAGSAPTPSVA